MVCGPASALDVSWFLCAKRAVYIVFLVWLSSYICFRVLTTLVNAAACVLRSYHLYVCSQIVFVVWSWLQPPKAAGEKDPRVLSEIPDTAMQVLLKCLSASEQANLRLVNHSICKLVGKNLPSLHLRLCEHSSSQQQLEQWQEAVQGHDLWHVTSIHVHIIGAVQAELFADAIYKLSQRTKPVTDLHLIAASSATLTSLAPLTRLASHLRSLVIQGIALPNLDWNMKQLTSTTLGWFQLKTLSLHVDWIQGRRVDWSSCAAALQRLDQNFPLVQQLEISLPLLDYSSIAALDALRLAAQAPLFVFTGAAGSCNSSYSAMAAVIAALSNSVLMHLRSLQVLKVTNAPDLWAAAADATAEAKEEAAQLARAYMDICPLTADATTALSSTLDDFGCWLLQQHCSLKSVEISIAGSSMGMTWQRPFPPTNDSKACCLVDNVTYESTALAQTGSADSNAAMDSSDSGTLLSIFMQYMSVYTLRAPHVVVQHISKCSLKLRYRDLGGLAKLLKDAKSLRSLKVTLDNSEHRSLQLPGAPSTFAAAAIKAAAAVHGLQSLTINMAAASREVLPCDLLLPLTPAAGGPGSSLKRLVLIGPFVASAAAAAGTSTLGSGPTPTSSFMHSIANKLKLGLMSLAKAYQNSRVTAYLKSTQWGSCAPPVFFTPLSIQRWCHSLKHLTGLNELTLKNQHRDLLSLPMECLPTGLTTFRCSRLKIVSDTVEAAVPPVISSTIKHKYITPHFLRLMGKFSRYATVHTLQLDCCQLDHPGYLRSDRLEVLSVSGSTWPGGWREAATAWPALQRLTCTPSLGAAPAVSRNMDDKAFVIQDICQGFKRLDHISMTNFPVVSLRYFRPESGWLSNIKQLRMEVLPDLDAVGYWSVEALYRQGKDPATIDSIISGTTLQECRELRHCLQQLLPWASVQVAIACSP